MNKKISLIVLVVFFVVFSSLFVFDNAFSDISKKRFYEQEFDPDKKKILIYGSSHSVQLNSTHINHKISQEEDNYIVYNMAENADKPKRRILNINNDVALNPEIIVYEISFRDFSSLKTEQAVNDYVHLIDLIPGDFTKLETMNPKLTTLQVARSVLIDILSDTPNSEIPYPNNPAFSTREIENIVPHDELRTMMTDEFDYMIINNYEQIEYFKNILNELQEKNIKVIILVSPLSNYAIESLPIQEKNKFFGILEEIKNEFNVKIYDLSEKYSKLDIWRDLTHVAYNPNALIFSDEVAEIIINEIEN